MIKFHVAFWGPLTHRKITLPARGWWGRERKMHEGSNYYQSVELRSLGADCRWPSRRENTTSETDVSHTVRPRKWRGSLLLSPPHTPHTAHHQACPPWGFGGWGAQPTLLELSTSPRANPICLEVRFSPCQLGKQVCGTLLTRSWGSSVASQIIRLGVTHILHLCYVTWER